MSASRNLLSELADIMVTALPPSEVRPLSNEVGGVALDQKLEWRGSPRTQILLLITELDRQHKLRELIEALKERISLDRYSQRLVEIQEQLESPQEPLLVKPPDNLSFQLAELRQQIVELQHAQDHPEQEDRIQQIIEATNLAIGESEELTARMLLPPKALTDVQLLPSHSLDRLEEYNSDKNVAFLFVGTFSGAILGVLSNWAADRNFTVTRISVILIILFIALTIVSWLWVCRLDQRSKRIKDQILHP